MIPRGIPDIGWYDLGRGLLYCLWPGSAAQTQARLEAAWAENSLACLSVRSGFDLTLRVLAFPAGSEVLTSALTIRDMTRILEHHHLVPVPLDVNPATLAVDVNQAARAISPKTKAILVAHLFGSRMPLDDLTQLAYQHKLLVFEDCAQVYDGSAYRGHPDSDVSMFSFGPIKTQTALGGAMFRFKDPTLLAQVRAGQSVYPRQPRRAFLRRVGMFAGLRFMASPTILRMFVWLCRARGIDYDRLLSSTVRAFAGDEFYVRIRHQPCAPLLRLLERRLTHPDPAGIARRVAFVERALVAMSQPRRPGVAAAHHTHWVMPILTNRPAQLAQYLARHGFDATRTASSLVAVLPPASHHDGLPTQAIQMMNELVYIPMYPPLSSSETERLGRLVVDFETDQS